MTESERIADQIHRSYHGTAWHGPALKEVLTGITHETAAAKPIPAAHSIWELVNHLHAWIAEANATLRGKRYESLQGDRDWPPVTETSPQAWDHTLAALEDAQRALHDATHSFPPEKLGEGDRSYYALLHGIVQHNAYHAGQIQLLKKK